jgi:hypothetical protein
MAIPLGQARQARGAAQQLERAALLTVELGCARRGV